MVLITENTRVGYPIDYIPNTVSSGVGPIPRTIFFLAADAFGVLPPISKLDRNAAIYHFVSGYPQANLLELKMVLLNQKQHFQHVLENHFSH